MGLGHHFIMLCLQIFITELLKVTIGHLLNCNGFSSWYILWWNCTLNDWLSSLVDDDALCITNHSFNMSFHHVQLDIFNILCNLENMFSANCNFLYCFSPFSPDDNHWQCLCWKYGKNLMLAGVRAKKNHSLSHDLLQTVLWVLWLISV